MHRFYNEIRQLDVFARSPRCRGHLISSGDAANVTRIEKQDFDTMKLNPNVCRGMWSAAPVAADVSSD
jgi:hypothetical protein